MQIILRAFFLLIQSHIISQQQLKERQQPSQCHLLKSYFKFLCIRIYFISEKTNTISRKNHQFSKVLFIFRFYLKLSQKTCFNKEEIEKRNQLFQKPYEISLTLDRLLIFLRILQKIHLQIVEWSSRFKNFLSPNAHGKRRKQNYRQLSKINSLALNKNGIKNKTTQIQQVHGKKLLKQIKINNIMNSKMKKVKAFFLTSVCAANTYAILGTFAVLKSSLSQEFGFSQNFLGVLDAVTQIGNLLSSICLAFVAIKKPKQAFFLTGCMQTMILMMMLLGVFIPEGLIHPFFTTLMLFLGTIRSVAFIPSLMLNQYFDWNEDKTWIGFWGSIIWIADPLIVLLYNITTNNFKWSWETYVIMYSSITLLASVGWQVLLEEIPPIQHTEEDKSLGQEIVRMASEMKRIMSQWRYVLLAIDQGLETMMYMNVLLWFPYYFTVVVNFPNYAPAIAIIYSLMVVVGSLVFEALSIRCEKWSGAIANAGIGMAVVMGILMLYFSFLEQTEQLMQVYMVLSAAQGFLTGGPTCRLSQFDLIMVTRGDNNDLYIFLVAVGAIKTLLSTICLYLVGFFLENGSNSSYENRSSFFWILLINISLFFIADIAMRVYVAHEDAQSEESDSASF